MFLAKKKTDTPFVRQMLTISLQKEKNYSLKGFLPCIENMRRLMLSFVDLPITYVCKYPWFVK